MTLKYKNFHKCAIHYINLNKRVDVLFLVRHLISQGWNDEMLIDIMNGCYSKRSIEFNVYKVLLGQNWEHKLLDVSSDYWNYISQQVLLLQQLRGLFV